jgi:hypothetical protein
MAWGAQHDLDDWQPRIKAVEREYLAVRFSTDRTQEEVRRDPTILHRHLDPPDLTRASEGLEGTYLTRMFAEFETGLRLDWATLRDTHPRAVELLNSIAGQRGIPDEQRDDAHGVRLYRNSLMHEREDEEVAIVTIARARGFLCTFFSFLPREGQHVADQLLAGSSRGLARIQARLFRQQALQNGARLSHELWAEGEKQGLKARALQRARHHLLIRPVRVFKGGV